MIEKVISLPVEVVIDVDFRKKIERWANRRQFGISWFTNEEKRQIEMTFWNDATPEKIESALKFLGTILRSYEVAAAEQKAREAAEAARVEELKHRVDFARLTEVHALARRAQVSFTMFYDEGENCFSFHVVSAAPAENYVGRDWSFEIAVDDVLEHLNKITK